MSCKTRSAKSDWTSNELEAFNIVIRNQSASTFFGQDLPATLAGIDPEFVDGTVPSEAANENARDLLAYLSLATEAGGDQESAIHDFAKELLHTLGFKERGFILGSRYTIPLLICGQLSTPTAENGIWLIRHPKTILLILQEDTEISAKDPEAQVIAKAVAAYQMNNRNDPPGFNIMSIPCITMVGTRPTFYIVPVTYQLSVAVEKGKYPKHMTEVRKCVVGEGNEGMEKLDFRVKALKHFILFHSLAKSLWSEFLPG